MEGKFTHYLVTRFNVIINGYGPEFVDSRVRDASWEQDRLPLFEHFCVPTIAGQYSLNFTWLIYLDVATDPEILQHIQRILNPLPSVKLFFVKDYSDMISHLRCLCAQVSTPFVITSRLDNDDGLGRQYIRKVQDHFEPSANVLLNLSGGVIYNMDKGILTHLHQSLNNSFGSLIEEVQSGNEIRTVYGFRHLVPPPEIRVKNIYYPHAFWMNLHQRNAGPRGNRGRPSWPSWQRRYYDIDFKYIQVSLLNSLFYMCQWLPKTILHKWRGIIHRASSPASTR